MYHRQEYCPESCAIQFGVGGIDAGNKEQEPLDTDVILEILFPRGFLGEFCASAAPNLHS